MPWVPIDKLEARLPDTDEITFGPLRADCVGHFTFTRELLGDFGVESPRSVTVFVDLPKGGDTPKGETVLLGLQFHSGYDGNRRIYFRRKRGKVSIKGIAKKLQLRPGRYRVRKRLSDPKGFITVQVSRRVSTPAVDSNGDAVLD